MIKYLKCNSCGGTYPDTTQGGIAYFHACPDRIVKTPEITDPVTHAIITPCVFQPTPNPRNENLMLDPANPGQHIIISAGTGVTANAPAPPIPVGP
jgi:hypothetical protein